MKDLIAEFLPMFIDSATKRLQSAREKLAQNDASAVQGDLHAVAGEAALLELAAFMNAAREGEAAAKKWRDTGSADERARCEQSFAVLDAALAELKK